MTSYILRRVLLMVPTLIGMTVMVWLVMNLSPGGLKGALMRSEGVQGLDSETRAIVEQQLVERYGLDDPWYTQFGRWVGNLSPVGRYEDEKTGREKFGLRAPYLGTVYGQNRPVVDVLAERLPPTLLLNAISIPIVYLIAIGSGIYMARYRGRAFDVLTGGGFLAMWSVPVIWAGVMLAGLLASRSGWYIFPSGGLSSMDADRMAFLPSWGGEGFARGWLLDRLWHLVLPVVCLSYTGFAFLSKLMRGAMLENLSADFVRTARAKGLTDRVVLFRHAFRNSLLPLITVAAGIIPGMLAGSVVVEHIFNIQGMGKLMIESITRREYELIMSVALIAGLINLVCLLLADLAYAGADPRVSYD